jgi:23S rRNA pseudouridine1911/1915/1917 synthase
MTNRPRMHNEVPGPHMPIAPLPILYEDNHCLAINKPAGLTSAHFQGKEQTLDRLVKEYIKDKYKKPGKVFLGVVHRLDKPVSGAMLFARTSKAAARLSEQFREGTIDKVYWAVVEGRVQNAAGTLEDWLRKNPETHRVDIVEPNAKGARQSLLHYQRRAVHNDVTWLEIRPQTGRTHQLRVQLAHHGHPICGDAKYGSTTTFGNAIALHARALTFLHPIRYDPIALVADIPDDWRERFLQVLHEARR